MSSSESDVIVSYLVSWELPVKGWVFMSRLKRDKATFSAMPS